MFWYLAQLSTTFGVNIGLPCKANKNSEVCALKKLVQLWTAGVERKSAASAAGCGDLERLWLH